MPIYAGRLWQKNETIIAKVPKEREMQEEKHIYKVQGACAKQGASKWHYYNNCNK